jgi:hypothetical protein
MRKYAMNSFHNPVLCENPPRPVAREKIETFQIDLYTIIALAYPGDKNRNKTDRRLDSVKV